MMIPQDNLALRQKDYAVFLPALSSFYSFQICKYGKKVLDQRPDRLPVSMGNGLRGLDFLRSDISYFYYPWCLYSAGHAILETGPEEKEEMVRNREPGAFVLGDSGGFQIAKGLWEGDWKANSGCAKAQKKRETVLNWLDSISDYAMILDIPTWVIHDKKASAACQITTLEEAVAATKFNNEYFMKHRRGKDNGGAKFLNVLQGDSHTSAEEWYQEMKYFCDPKIYPDKHFDGWAMGGQNMCDVHLVLKRIVSLIRDGLLEKGKHDWMHFLGTSKLEWAVLLTDIQRAIRKYHNENFTISFDCASPFLANAKGLVYDYTRITHNEKWTYSMEGGIDDKKYATDTRLYGDVARDDNLIPNFTDSHITKYIEVRDICTYKPGDLNLIGKEGKTSWDSISYTIQMAHNVWAHINAVQTANEQYDLGIIPNMLAKRITNRLFKDVVDEIIANAGNQKGLDLIEENSRFWMDIIGQRGYTGKKTVNSNTQFNVLFE